MVGLMVMLELGLSTVGKLADRWREMVWKMIIFGGLPDAGSFYQYVQLHTWISQRLAEGCGQPL